MIPRNLIEKLILLVKDYQKENADPNLISPFKQIVMPVVNAGKSMVGVDLTVKAEKKQASEELIMFLEGISKDPKTDIGALIKIQERFEAEKTKAKEIRKNKSPAAYDAILDICSYVIERTLFYCHFTSLKNAKDEDFLKDPRIIVEHLMIDCLMNAEIWKETLKRKEVPKATVKRMGDVFSGFGVKDESLVVELIKQVQEFLYKLDIACKGIDKTSLQYILIVNTNMLLASYEQSERWKAKNLTSDPFKNLLQQANVSIKELDAYNNAKARLASLKDEMFKKEEQVNQEVRLLLSQRFAEQKSGAESKLISETEQTRQKAEAEQKKADETRAKAEADAKKKQEDEARKKAEEAAKKKQEEETRKKAAEDAAKTREQEEARRRASDERKKEEERRKKEEAEKAKKHQEESAKPQPQPSQPQPQPQAPAENPPAPAVMFQRLRAQGRNGMISP